jgi:hypothetical protein
MMEAESLPAAARYSDHGVLSGCNIRARRHAFRMSVSMKDEIVDQAAFNENVGVVKREPMKIVAEQVACEQVLVLALR